MFLHNNFFSTPIGVPGKTQGMMFTPVPANIDYYATERVGVDQIKKVSALVLFFFFKECWAPKINLQESKIEKLFPLIFPDSRVPVFIFRIQKSVS